MTNELIVLVQYESRLQSNMRSKGSFEVLITWNQCFRMSRSDHVLYCNCVA